MPFVLPPGVAIGSQQSIYLKALYDSEQAGGSAANVGPDMNFSMLMSTEGTNITEVFTGSGKLFDISANNGQAANLYLKLYDMNRAPVLATDIPLRTEIMFGLDNLNRMMSALEFADGLWFAITASIEPDDETAIDAGAVMAMNITYRLGA